MHACESPVSTRTLCGLAVHVPTIGVVWGFKAVCPGCYPEENPIKGPGEALPIPGREGMDDHVPDEEP